MKLDNLGMKSAKPSVPARNQGLATPQPSAYASRISPAQSAAPSHAPHPAAKRAITGEDRRRTQRVLLRVRANIHVALEGQSSSFDVITLSVNHQGALVIMEKNLPPDTRLVLEHTGTRERVACKVARGARLMPGGFHVPIEFDSPSPDFWRIAFPPSDWRPDDL